MSFAERVSAGQAGSGSFWTLQVTGKTTLITEPDSAGIERTDVLGGLIHEYRLVA